MLNYLIVLSHEVDEETEILTPLVVQADDLKVACEIAEIVQSVLKVEYGAETSFKVVRI